MARAQAYIAEGYAWVVDIDLEKFFDRVNHDILMGLVAKRVADKRILKLIRGFLTAGVLAGRAGRPDGGGHAARRAALAPAVEPDAGRAGQGAGDARPSVRALCRRLQHLRAQPAGRRTGDGQRRDGSWPDVSSCKVNAAKSAVARPSRRKFLGFSFTRDGSHGGASRRRRWPGSRRGSGS